MEEGGDEDDSDEDDESYEGQFKITYKSERVVVMIVISPLPSFPLYVSLYFLHFLPFFHNFSSVFHYVVPLYFPFYF